MPADEVTHGTDVDESCARTGPRHAAPKKPLFTRFHMPTGRTIASVAMPTAVLMGMGFTSSLALADSGTPTPKPSKSLSADDYASNLSVDQYKDCVAALDGSKDKTDTPSPSASEADKSDGTSKDEAEPKPSASSGGQDTPGTPSSPDSGSGDAGTPSPSASPEAPESGSGSTSSAPSSSSDGGLLGGLGDAVGGLLGGGGSTPSASASPTPSPSATGDAAGSVTGSVKDTVDQTTKTVGDTVKGTTDTVSKTVGGTTEAVRKAAEAAASGTGPAADSGASADGCPVATDETGGVDNAVPVADDPWYLNASSLLLKGADYQGIVQVKTASGGTKKVLKYVISDGTDIGDLHQTVKDKQSGKTYHVQAAKGSTSTIRDGKTVMYTESISGNLFGLIPLKFTPDSPPPLNLPLIYFTDVHVTQAAQFGGSLHVPGMHVFTTD
ncbi:hypothetical protein [Streptomyces sp. V3I7]|uniref:hypothetical protein n=1 Tax=Streptomyces sp. V3I7 TaxID=3042278 RepID=UPI00277FBA15|nr:hypothetical protein [Streptomyces sp. V3I7]MDQ0993113.1 hypothetical protein [Streptomyces sp. V3I7]